MTNQAYGISVTADFEINDSMALKFIFSDRRSQYKAGLDDDSFFDNFLAFPEIGEADQTSYELQMNGKTGAFDYVFGLYHFEEEGHNFQNDTTFNCGTAAAPCTSTTGGTGGDFFLHQKVDSDAAYANVGYAVNDNLRLSAGVRHTRDDKSADTVLFQLISEANSRNWNETSWDVSGSYKFNDRMTLYGTIQSGYQSGQYPARPYCLIGSFDFGTLTLARPNCFVANDNVTARNYEIGLKGQPFDNLEMSIAVFNTDYSDLPYQVSSTAGGGSEPSSAGSATIRSTSKPASRWATRRPILP